MIHYQTTNDSFLKVYQFLKQKGIKNNAFFLELLDESLATLDPFDTDLTEEQQQRIIIECTRNPWYFIRECVRISTSGVTKYELNLGNLALSWACLNDFNSFTIMPRQTGKTFGAMVIITWILYFGGRNTEMMLVAQADKNLQNNMNRIRAIRDALPQYLRLKDKKDRDGAELIDFKPLGNRVMKSTTGSSDTESDSKGRGLSLPVLQIDEISFCKHIAPFFQASVLAHSNVAERAKENHLPNFISMTTTAGYLNDENGLWAFNFMNDCLDFDESMYDMNRDQIETLMRNEAKRKYFHIEYQYYDLGKDDNYFERMCNELGGDKDAVDREVLCKWKSVSTVHPLGQDIIVKLNNNIMRPKKIVVINDIYRLRLYREPEEMDWSIPYIIGGDCSNNVGEDYSALVIVDPYTYEVIGTIRANQYSTMLWAQMIADLMTKYFFRSTLILERNLNGATILDRVIEIDNNLVSRIYGSIDPRLGQIKKLGIDTTKQARKLVYGQVLKIAVDDSFDRIHDRTIIKEIESLVMTRSGRVDHPQGGHDDLLISYLFARWFLIFGEMQERYIDPLKIGVLYNEYNSSLGGKEMRSITNTRISEIAKEERKKELNIGKDSFKDTQDVLRAQKESIDNFDSVSSSVGEGIVSLNRNRSFSSQKQGVFDRIGNYIANRYNPNRPDSAKEGDGKIYTLDDEEMNTEEEKVLDDEYQRNIYNKNPRNIDFNERELSSQTQDIRQAQVKYHGNTNDLATWFRTSGLR